MPAAAWVTLILTFLIVAAAALGLIRVIGHLVAIHRTLGAVVGGVRVIADKTSTVPAELTAVNESLQPVADFCEAV
jgi:hypothetical protein